MYKTLHGGEGGVEGMADWDARTYHTISNPHQQWAGPILDRLRLRGDEVALDAGCGSGRVTRLLLERLPRGRVYGVDRSPAMLAVAREELADAAGRVTLIEGDLTAVRLPEPMDAVFSSATFHWIHDHDALFRNLAVSLRPGGRLSVQCGGAGNIATVKGYADDLMARAPFIRHGTVSDPYNFAGPHETATRLQAAGFGDVQSWLEPAPVAFPDERAFHDYLKTVVLGPYLAALPESLHDAFIAAVVGADAAHGARRTVDYVRLNITAVRDG
jgi:trans-aconitate 2-methyltransferase